MIDHPADLGDLAASVDALLAPAPPSTEIVVPRDGAIRRLGLALDASADALAWAAERACDALLVHRHWAAPAWPVRLGVLANHDAFDRRFSLAMAPELHAVLGLRDATPLDVRDGWPLAVVGTVATTGTAAVGDALAALFGDVEEALGTDDRVVDRIVVARAMTASLVERAASAGADVYVTGQIRAPARQAVAATGLHVVAVGHRRSEAWAMRRLGALLRVRWPGLDVVLAEGEAGAERGSKPSR